MYVALIDKLVTWIFGIKADARACVAIINIRIGQHSLFVQQYWDNHKVILPLQNERG